MVLGEVGGVIAEIGQIALWLQAIGIVVVLWIVFQFITWRYNRRRMREMEEIRKDMRRIEGKIDRILGKK